MPGKASAHAALLRFHCLEPTKAQLACNRVCATAATTTWLDHGSLREGSMQLAFQKRAVGKPAMAKQRQTLCNTPERTR